MIDHGTKLSCPVYIALHFTQCNNISHHEILNSRYFALGAMSEETLKTVGIIIS
jgi:hypothetical protein